MTIMFSVEICVRLYKAKKRVQDPDLDNLTNPHEVKHWMDPRIIPFGWGLFKEEEQGVSKNTINNDLIIIYNDHNIIDNDH